MNLSKEIWKDVDNYEGLYQVSNLGRVKSVERINNYNKKVKERILKPISNGEYYKVGLSKNGIVKQFFIHRLVANAFLSNPNNYPIINHKDENKLNNVLENLEWCTYYHNNTYGVGQSTKSKILHNTQRKECWAFNLSNKEYLHFNSYSEASRFLNINISDIIKVINDEYRQYKGWTISKYPIEIIS